MIDFHRSLTLMFPLALVISSSASAQFSFSGREGADRFFGYLDRNRDGRLDRDEMRRLPGPLSDALKRARVDTSQGLGRDDFSRVAPRAFEEMRRQREQDREREERKRMERDRDRERDQSRKQAEADRLIKFYTDLDTNGNKVIEPNEVTSSRHRSTIEKRIRDAGLDPSRPVPLSIFMAKRLQNAGLKPDEAVKLSKGFGDPRRSFFAKKRDRITIDLPSSYSIGDLNEDGQLTLAEWRQWKGRKAISQFGDLDRNGDGHLTPRELSEPVATKLAVPETSNRRSFSTSPPQAATRVTPAATSKAPAAANPTVEREAISAFGTLDGYGNKDGKINEKEWRISRTIKPVFEKFGVDLSQDMDRSEFVRVYLKVFPKGRPRR